MKENTWTKCYEDSWKDHIVPEAFSHPAKMSYGLLKRILDHCKDKGWGGVIVDPFGGIGSTGILGAYDGYQVICIELEAKFVEMARFNFELHRKGFEQFDCPYPVILQGDSRKLCELVESADIIVSSPPFLEQMQQPKGGMLTKWCEQHGRNPNAPSRKQIYDAYGQTPGQLGSMKPGKVDMVISSPPYAESLQGSGGDRLKETDTFKISRSQPKGNGYGHTDGNLGNLKAGDVDVILSSPPYEECLSLRGGRQRAQAGVGNSTVGKDDMLNKSNAYSGNSANIGNQQGDTFWQAAKEILQQCHKILRPGGHAIWVCKDFVRKGKRVPFSDDWLKLCESVGFKLVCRHRAMLVKESVHNDLFGGQITKKTERKSFFRRLAEAKGSPKIDWEDVLCVEKIL